MCRAIRLAIDRRITHGSTGAPICLLAEKYYDDCGAVSQSGRYPSQLASAPGQRDGWRDKREDVGIDADHRRYVIEPAQSVREHCFFV